MNNKMLMYGLLALGLLYVLNTKKEDQPEGEDNSGPMDPEKEPVPYETPSDSGVVMPL